MAGKGGGLCFQQHFQFNLVPQRDVIVTDPGDFGLDGARVLHGVWVKRRQRKAAFLVEAQRIEVIVGGDQPQAAASVAISRTASISAVPMPMPSLKLSSRVISQSRSTVR